MNHRLCDKRGAVYNLHPCDAAEIAALRAALKKVEEERDVAYARIQAQQYDIDAAEAHAKELYEESLERARYSKMEIDEMSEEADFQLRGREAAEARADVAEAKLKKAEEERDEAMRIGTEAVAAKKRTNEILVNTPTRSGYDEMKRQRDAAEEALSRHKALGYPVVTRELARAREGRGAAEARVEELLQIIEKAPHSGNCAVRCANPQLRTKRHAGRASACDCFKAREALEREEKK